MANRCDLYHLVLLATTVVLVTTLVYRRFFVRVAKNLTFKSTHIYIWHRICLYIYTYMYKVMQQHDSSKLNY